MSKPCVITIFGAESTGKTTLSKAIAQKLGGEWREEFARRYLETTGQDVTNDSMRAIWCGQKALQSKAATKLVIQDTDLFSTVGYWQLPHIEPQIGTCPRALIHDALTLQSDLYIITKSNIPFAADILRYGGDKRESPDSYWINICERYELPYIVLDASDPTERILKASRLITERRKLCVA